MPKKENQALTKPFALNAEEQSTTTIIIVPGVESSANNRNVLFHAEISQLRRQIGQI
jgi:hypothetical protein